MAMTQWRDHITDDGAGYRAGRKNTCGTSKFSLAQAKAARYADTVALFQGPWRRLAESQ
jgi:hypothetical protein